MPSGKHLFPSPDPATGGLVLPALRALAAQTPSLTVIPHEKVIYDTAHNPAHVALLSGGGAGHEPAHAGYVGEGMLTVAVSGEVFASPRTNQVLAGIKAVAPSLFRCPQVSGRSGEPSFRSRSITIADDVAVPRSRIARVGRRGLAGTVLVHKIAGGLASQGAGLDAVHAIAQRVNNSLVTAGVSLDRCHVPGRPHSDTDSLPTEEAELGMGIHNEPGVKRLSPIPTADDLASDILKMLLDPTDPERAYVPFAASDATVLMVNNLGGTSILELSAFASTVLSALDSKWGIKPVRVLVGTYMTSLDAPGVSVTLLNCGTGPKSQELLDLIDLPVRVPGWHSIPSQSPAQTIAAAETLAPESSVTPSDIGLDSRKLISALRSGAQALLKAEPEITHFDTIAGDGDCGHTLCLGANALLSLSSSAESSGSGPTMRQIADAVEGAMGGTSGVIYSIYLNAFATALSTPASGGVSPEVWLRSAANAALDSLLTYTTARPGDRTLIDALLPFCHALRSGSTLDDALSKAREGVESTRGMKAGVGRAVYVEEGKAEGEGVPDPGAWGVVVLLEGLAQGWRIV
ncbi:Dihydroxyacetone kinase 2 [Saitoella coloradoensis]